METKKFTNIQDFMRFLNYSKDDLWVKYNKAYNESRNEVAKLCKFHEIDLSNYKGEQRKDKIARNLVDYEAGLTIFNTARNIISQSNIKRQSLFDAVSYDCR